MSTPGDDLNWRLDNARHLARATRHWRPYNRWSETRDHDHCAACWAKFTETACPDTFQHEYATGDDHPNGARYDWVCRTCFDDLKSALKWTSPDTSQTSSAAC
jgi:hypothetical protein